MNYILIIFLRQYKFSIISFGMRILQRMRSDLLRKPNLTILSNLTESNTNESFEVFPSSKYLYF
jgi:hypothetical protein